MEEACLQGDIGDLLGVYSDPTRDPRGHTITVAYVLKVAGIIGIAAGDDADEARWFPIHALPPLAFDHAIIVADALRWLSLPGNFEKLADTEFGKCA